MKEEPAIHKLYNKCMNACGIIAEFNPFHQGHAYLLHTVKDRIGMDVLIVILSTYFSSRGLPSIMTPEAKIRYALEEGADLVIALPSVYAMQSADYFARAAVDALHKAGVTSLYFGSESADLPFLRSVIEAQKDLAVDPSTSQARNAARLHSLPPNDLLAAAYLKACAPYHIQCIAIERDQSLQSATWLRQALLDRNPSVSSNGCDLKQNWNSYYPLLRYMLLETDPAVLASFFLVEEGVENRLIENARRHDDWRGFLEASITRTYSRARIQRICMMILLQISKTEMKEHRRFDTIQVLGMTPKGQAWLKSLPDSNPVCTRLADLPPFERKIELKSRRLYDLIGQSETIWKPIRYDPNALKEKVV